MFQRHFLGTWWSRNLKKETRICLQYHVWRTHLIASSNLLLWVLLLFKNSYITFIISAAAHYTEAWLSNQSVHLFRPHGRPSAQCKQTSLRFDWMRPEITSPKHFLLLCCFENMYSEKQGQRGTGVTSPNSPGVKAPFISVLNLLCVSVCDFWDCGTQPFLPSIKSHAV